MKMEKKRLFVGNLPPTSSEDLLTKRFKKYGSVLSVELKKRADGSVFGFVDLETNSKDLELCLNKISQKPWDDYEIKVELAKESFLSRLQRERESAKAYSFSSPVRNEKSEISSVKKGTKSIPRIKKQSIVSPKKAFVNSENEIKESVKQAKQKHLDIPNNKQLTSSENVIEENGRWENKNLDGSSSEDEDERQKGNIPMFRGIMSVEEQPGKSYAVSETDLLQRFESFSDTWKDDPYDTTHPTQNIHINNDFPAKDKRNKDMRNEMVENSYEHDKWNEVSGEADKHQKNILAEQKRLQSIAERKKSFLQRKQAVTAALMKIDSNARTNRKIILDDDTSYTNDSFPDKTVLKRNISETQEYRSKKGKLFSDDESENENNDFRIKSQFEGLKGQKLLALQARYGNDNRFTLDERFYESDDNAELDVVKEEDVLDEKKKQLHILGSILGKELIAPVDKNIKQKRKSMLRFDPTKSDHMKYELKKTPDITSSEIQENASKSNETASDKIQPEKNVGITPAVSKDKYYEVTDTLKESLSNKNDKFSLLDMFGSSDLKENGETHQDDVHKEIRSKKKIGWSLNPFKYDSSESEEEQDQKPLSVEKTTFESHNVWHESFFFSPNDSRLQDGIKFLKFKNETDENFSSKRRELKHIIRSKVKNNQRKKLVWKKKLGGKRFSKNNLEKKKKIKR